MNDSVTDGKKLYATGRLKGEWPAGDLIATAEVLKAYRDSIMARKKKIFAALAVCVVVLFLFAIFLSDWSVVFLVGLVVLVAAIVSMIVTLARMKEERYDADAAVLLGTLARCLGPDLARGSAFKVDAALRSATAGDYFVKDGEEYDRPGCVGCFDKFFKRHVLNLACDLSDGTRVQVDALEHTVQAVLSKKNRRGKTKTKKKNRRKIGFRVRVQLDQTRNKLTGEFKLPTDAAVRVRPHPRGPSILLSTRKVLKGEDRIDAGPILALLAAAYTAVTPVQQNTSTPSGGAQ